MKEFPNANNAPPLRTKGWAHKPSVNHPHTNKGARLRNTQTVGTSESN